MVIHGHIIRMLYIFYYNDDSGKYILMGTTQPALRSYFGVHFHLTLHGFTVLSHGEAAAPRHSSKDPAIDSIDFTIFSVTVFGSSAPLGSKIPKICRMTFRLPWNIDIDFPAMAAMLDHQAGKPSPNHPSIIGRHAQCVRPIERISRPTTSNPRAEICYQQGVSASHILIQWLPTGNQRQWKMSHFDSSWYSQLHINLH